MFCNDVVWKPVAIYTTSNLFAQQMPTGSELWRATECILDLLFLTPDDGDGAGHSRDRGAQAPRASGRFTKMAARRRPSGHTASMSRRSTNKVCALSHQPVASLMHVLRRATEATLQGEDGGAFLPA